MLLYLQVTSPNNEGEASFLELNSSPLCLSSGNPLLLNSSMPPDLTVGRTYSTPLCFQDAADKELFDPLPDIKVKVQSSFMVSLGVAERAEFHAKAPAETFPRDFSRDYCSTADRHKKGLLTLNGPFSGGREQLRTGSVFGHTGGRLVVPNTGELRRTQAYGTNPAERFSENSPHGNTLLSSSHTLNAVMRGGGVVSRYGGHRSSKQDSLFTPSS